MSDKILYESNLNKIEHDNCCDRVIYIYKINKNHGICDIAKYYEYFTKVNIDLHLR